MGMTQAAGAAAVSPSPFSRLSEADQAFVSGRFEECVSGEVSSAEGLWSCADRALAGSSRDLEDALGFPSVGDCASRFGGDRARTRLVLSALRDWAEDFVRQAEEREREDDSRFGGKDRRDALDDLAAALEKVGVAFGADTSFSGGPEEGGVLSVVFPDDLTDAALERLEETEAAW